MHNSQFTIKDKPPDEGKPPDTTQGGVHKRIAVKAAISGAIAGGLNGFFGGGGGMLLVPLLGKWLKLDEKKAFATSVMIIAPMCAVSAAVYLFKNSLDFAEALPYLCGGLAGGVIAGIFMKKVPAKVLKRILAAIIIISGLRSLIWA